MSEYINVQLGSSFLLNAGICGFIRFLRSNNAEEEKDFRICNQTLEISKDYIINNNIPEMYVDTMVSLFEEDTKFYRIVNSESKRIEKYNENIDSIDDKGQKELNDLYKNFEDMMLKASFISGYDIIESYDNVVPVTETMIKELKKEKDLRKKYNLYHKIIELLNQKIVKKVLIFKEITYSKLKLFFGESEFCLKTNTLKTGESIFDKDFYQPLIKEIGADDKKKKKICIECLTNAYDTKSISFMVDTTDDVNRKKSYYWNCKPDAYVCPVCAFIYSFAPLGFAFTGAECVFINSNGGIDNLTGIMETYRVKNEISDDKSGKKKRMYRVFTSEKIDMMKMKLSNFQVITRSPDYSHFKFSVIDKITIEKLNYGKKHLSAIEKIWLKADSKNDYIVVLLQKNDAIDTEKKDIYISVYDSVMDCITEKKSMYVLIDILLRKELSKGNDVAYIKNILRLQIIFYGGTEMENLNIKLDSAFMAGVDLRKKILGEKANVANSDEENSIRGFVYRLVNLSSVGDVSQFVDAVIRIYSGFGLTIPSVFKECYKSEEMFKAISHGFILGLKYVKYNKEEKING